MADSQRKSYNLFDKTATNTDKGYLNNQRLNLTTIENSSNVAISEYISVDTSAAYYTLSGILTSGQYNASLAFYDNQYNPIQGYRYQGLASIRAQVPENAAYLRFTIIKANIDEIMLLKGYYATAEIPPYEPYGWVHSLRKLTTATEAVENPLYSDGTAITNYTIKGNTVQNGTPSPSSPITISGVGNKTANLLKAFTPNTESSAGINYVMDGDKLRIYGTTTSYSQCVSTNTITLQAGTYTLSFTSSKQNSQVVCQLRSVAGTTTYASTLDTPTFTLAEETEVRPRAYCQGSSANPFTTDELIGIMLNEGSSARSYEPPEKYKIPISSGQTALNPMYFSQQLYKIGDTTDSVISSGTATYAVRKYEITGQENIEWKKSTAYLGGFYTSWRNSFNGIDNAQFYCSHAQYVASLDNYQQGTCYSDGSCNIRIMPDSSTVQDWIDYLTTQYANGTPVTIVYKLITPTTETVTAPSIPTTEGANSITVDTTVQPSEFTATWTGWHDAYVKEKSENLFDYQTMSNGEDNFYLLADGSKYSNDAWRITDYIPCELLSVTLTRGMTNQTPAICGYDENKQYIAGVSYNNNTEITLTSQQTIKYIRFSWRKVNPTEDISQIMLNEGSTALPYEPYWK